MSDQFHQFGYAISVDLILLEQPKHPSQCIERALLIDKLYPRGVADDLSIFAAPFIFREHVQLGNCFTSALRYVLN